MRGRRRVIRSGPALAGRLRPSSQTRASRLRVGGVSSASGRSYASADPAVRRADCSTRARVRCKSNDPSVVWLTGTRHSHGRAKKKIPNTREPCPPPQLPAGHHLRRHKQKWEVETRGKIGGKTGEPSGNSAIHPASPTVQHVKQRRQRNRPR